MTCAEHGDQRKHFCGILKGYSIKNYALPRAVDDTDRVLENTVGERELEENIPFCANFYKLV